ncbi:MAG: stage III sporulation protein AB [Firmicutes bacterium]|nr:stage III sporulation protein AB [Bacillota bacterium]
MIIKVITSCIIVSSSTLIGLELAKQYVLRTRVLRELQGALSRLETEILHYSTRLPEAMYNIGDSIKGETGKLFKCTSDLLTSKKNIMVSEAWRSSLNQLKGRLFLQSEEFDILYRFGDQLGSSDKDGQVKYIRLTLSQLHLQELKAQETRDKYERMYKSLGLLSGIAIAIMLL